MGMATFGHIMSYVCAFFVGAILVIVTHPQ